jgi:DNA-binding beta-propeller fold protein YncE
LRVAPVAIGVLVLCAALFGCGSSSAPFPGPGSHRYAYAAVDDGSIHVYDIDHGHREVASFVVGRDVIDMRGACASAATGVLYLAHQRAESGYVIAVDLRSQRLVWNNAYRPNVDRLACAAGGRKLYVPSNEAFPDDELIVVDAATGSEFGRIHISPQPHDCVANLSGGHVYVETKSSDTIDIVDTTTDAVTSAIGPFSGIGGPFTIDGRESRLYGNFFGVNGFQVADISSGRVVATATISGQTPVDGQLDQHGIALNPSETEVWVNDGVGGQAIVHVFDITVAPPVPKREVAIGFAGPHWITFSIAGDFAYVSGPKSGGRNAEVIDAKTYERVASIGPSEDIVEVDWVDGAIARVGDQFGVGRVETAP